MEPLARDGTLWLRRMQDSAHDYALIVRWENAPHVKEPSDPEAPPMTEAGAREVYAARTQEGFPTVACIIMLGDRPVGYIQYYRWSSWPDDAREMNVEYDASTFGLDIYLGEPSVLGLGFGKRSVALMCQYLFDTLAATRVTLLTPVRNERAQRVYESVGFRKVRRALDKDTQNGERIDSWMMSVERPA